MELDQVDLEGPAGGEILEVQLVRLVVLCMCWCRGVCVGGMDG